MHKRAFALCWKCCGSVTTTNSANMAARTASSQRNLNNFNAHTFWDFQTSLPRGPTLPCTPLLGFSCIYLKLLGKPQLTVAASCKYAADSCSCCLRFTFSYGCMLLLLYLQQFLFLILFLQLLQIMQLKMK